MQSTLAQPCQNLSRMLTVAAREKINSTSLHMLTALQEAKDANHEPLTPTKLAAVLGCSIPYTTNLSDRLVKRGLMSRENCTKDRRSFRLSILPSGTEILNKILNPTS